MSLHISSRQNPKVKEAISLYKHHEREKQGRFIIEGYRELSRAVQAQHPISLVFICPDLYLGSHENELLSKIQAPIYTCTTSVFEALSYRDRPDGLLALAPIQRHGLEILTHANPCYVVAEAIEKPGNLGTILRSADGAGADGVIVCDPCTDLFNPNVVRASVGTLFTQPVVQTTSEHLEPWLKARGIKIIATTPSADTLYTDVDLTQPVAILMGTEQYGLSEKWMKAADIRVKIPMKGVADSLNVAMATTLLLYEMVRQRQ
ncbi:MAG: RNA methyltransferase [Verrucomicrobia bacterium]|nr:RNA methyltransferase [Verrucomicrobiota bacterium]MBS0646597.1 RNA methyltransferase [Verrucomicrobiota bacterium]